MASGWQPPGWKQFQGNLQNATTQANIAQYGSPQGQQPGQPGGQPDLSFLNDPSNPYNIPGTQQYDSLHGYATAGGGGGGGGGSADSGSAAGGSTVGTVYDPNAIANTARDVALQKQNMQLNLLSQMNETAQYNLGQQEFGLQQQQFGLTQQQFGLTNQGYDVQRAGVAAEQATDIRNAAWQSGQVSQDAAARGATTSQGNRASLANVQANLKDQLGGLARMLQTLDLSQKGAALTNQEAILGNQQSQLQNQGQGLTHKVNQAQYNYNQQAIQTGIQDALQPYGDIFKYLGSL